MSGRTNARDVLAVALTDLGHNAGESDELADDLLAALAAAGLTVGGVRSDWSTACATCDGTTWVPDSGPYGVTCPDCDEDGEA